MKLADILQEAPLPDDWDKDIWDEKVPFKKRVEYARKRAKQLGIGSARIAFEIPYKGRDTVLKIAQNHAGVAQNKVEVEMLTEPHLKSMNIAIPIIDYDERNSSPTWIHMEKAKPLKQSVFSKLISLPGVKATLRDLVFFAMGKKLKKSVKKYEDLINTKSGFVKKFLKLVMLYDDLEVEDFNIIENWGMYKNNPVIIDIGLTTEVLDSEY